MRMPSMSDADDGRNVPHKYAPAPAPLQRSPWKYFHHPHPHPHPPTLPAPHLFYLHLSIPKMPESHPGSPRIPSRIVQDRLGLVFLLHALGFHPTPVSGSFRIVQDRSGFFRDPPAIALIMRVGVDRQDSLKTLGGFLEDSWRILQS